MVSEAGSGEGSTAQGPWVILVVGGGAQEAGACGSPGAVGEVGTARTLAGGSGKEATIFRVEVVQQGGALEEGEVAGIREELGLLVEDILQVVEVVVEEEQEEMQAEEREEKPQEQGQEEPELGPTTARPLLEALGALQLELNTLNAQASRASARSVRGGILSWIAEGPSRAFLAYGPEPL